MKFKIKSWPFAGVLLLGFCLLYFTAVTVSETDSSCGSCHNKEKANWKQSTHGKVHCRECHIKEGFSGKLEAQAGGLKNLWVSITRGNEIKPHEKPIPLASGNCMKCHAAILRVNEIGFEDLPENSLKGMGLIMAHKIHVETYDISCVECHRGIVHRNPADIGKYKNNKPFMHNDCGVCHNGTISERFEVAVTDLEDRAKCVICHPVYEPPSDYYSEEY